jgi:hypothetical protein
MSELPSLTPQEIPFDHPDSRYLFQPGSDKPFLAAAAVIATYSYDVILKCLSVLRAKADEHHGLDCLQVVRSSDEREDLWFMEDGPGGAITALLPSDH